MSRRTSNRERLARAAAAAVAADAWIGRSLRQSVAGQALPEDVARRVLEIPRMRRTLGNRIGPLLNLFRDHPEWADWLATPARVRKLANYSGAVVAGGTLSRFVSRADIAELAAAIGPDAVKFGMQHGGTGKVLATEPGRAADLVRSEGARSVRDAVADKAPALAGEIVCEAGLAPAGRPLGLSPERRLKAVSLVMEQVKA